MSNQLTDEENTIHLRRIVKGLIAQYDDMNAEIQPLLEAIKPFVERLGSVESDIKDSVLRLGETVEHAGWVFTYRQGSEKEVIEVDGEALAGYAVAHPEVNAFITRTTKTTKANVAKSRAK